MIKSLWAMGLTLFLAPAFAYDLSQHQWRDRLLILVADDPQDGDLRGQLRALEQEQAEVEDRDLRILHLTADEGWLDRRPLSIEETRHLQHLLDVAPGQRQLILIGLDGEIKRRSELSTDLSEVFAQIDAMPMRRAELDGR